METTGRKKKHLLIYFKHRYNKVQCIINCFEVSIQKPTNPLLHAFTLFEYKKCNTFKYLIRCAPDGKALAGERPI